MTSLATTQPGEHLEQPISRDVSVAGGLLDRDDLVQLLDRAVTKRVTVISAPPGSGKTSLLRARRARPAGRAAVLVRRAGRDP
jgi:LuxR family maltose regulon positive regulatory protein